MPKQVIIHAGFHKTGTSTIQRALRVNRPLLKPYLRSVLKHPLTDTCHAARGYSTWRDPFTLGKFRRRFRAALAEIGDMPRRSLVISAEELSGHLPGREGIPDYSAAIPLARDMCAMVAEVMPGTPLTFFYTTRAAGPWLRSAYWQHVRASSLTTEADAYLRDHAASARLEDIARQVEAQVTARVLTSPLEQTADLPAGPATPLLDLCEVPRDVQAQMQIQHMNPGLGDAVLGQLLHANRTIADPEERTAAKQAIIEQAGGDHD